MNTGAPTSRSLIVKASGTQVVYSCIALGSIAFVAVLVIANPGGVLLLLFVPYFAVVGVRGLTLRFEASPSGLRVRNFFRSYTFDWSDVGNGFVERRVLGFGFPATAICVETTDERLVKIAATQIPGTRTAPLQRERLAVLDALHQDYRQRNVE